MKPHVITIFSDLHRFMSDHYSSLYDRMTIDSIYITIYFTNGNVDLLNDPVFHKKFVSVFGYSEFTK